ncbi:hypothetical protein AALC25_12990 [Lachnospiraceae bacterium 29-84]
MPKGEKRRHDVRPAEAYGFTRSRRYVRTGSGEAYGFCWKQTECADGSGETGREF